MLAAFEKRLRKGFLTAGTILQKHRNSQGALLGHENQPIGLVGSLLESRDIGRRHLLAGRHAQGGEVHRRRGDEARHDNLRHRGRRAVVDHDGQLRQQVVEDHLHGTRCGQHILLHGSQQVGSLTAAALVRSHGEALLHTVFRIGIIGRQSRGFVLYAVPCQPVADECRTLVGHFAVPDVVARGPGDGQSDAIVLFEIEARSTRKDRGFDSDLPGSGIRSGPAGATRKKKCRKQRHGIGIDSIHS